jgi:hypothetical protein
MTDVHPDDEALSAYLDDEEPLLRDHIEGCEACRDRLDQFREVRDAIAAPIDRVPGWQRDAAITGALSATAGRPAEPWHRGVAARATGVAAALLVVIGAALALTQLADSDRNGAESTTAAGQTAADAGKGGAAERATTLAPGTVGDLGDLGELDNSAALRAIVEPKTAALAQAGGMRAGQEFAPAAPPAQGNSQDAAALEREVLDCAGKTQALDPENIGPTYAGTATWQGTPAGVLVYAVQGQADAVHVYVVARSDCRVLEFQSYRP